MMDYKELIGKLTFWRDVFLIRSMGECQELLDDAAAAIETLLEERDAAINLLRTLAWCNGCVHFKGLEGCGIGIMEECNEGNDHYQFCGAKMGIKRVEAKKKLP